MRERALDAGRAVLLLVLSASCGRPDAEGVADDFVDRVFVRFDQRGGLELADGHARLALERELRLVGDVRGENTGVLREQPRVYYDRGTATIVDGVTVVPYDVQTRLDHGEVRRVVRVSVAQRGGHWRVVDYETREPRPPRP